MSARLEWDLGAVDEFMQESPEVHDAKVRTAEAALRYAQSIAPVRTGDYVASLFVMDEGAGGTVALASSSSIYHIIEWGSIKNEPWRPMASAVEAVTTRYEAM